MLLLSIIGRLLVILLVCSVVGFFIYWIPLTTLGLGTLLLVTGLYGTQNALFVLILLSLTVVPLLLGVDIAWVGPALRRSVRRKEENKRAEKIDAKAKEALAVEIRIAELRKELAEELSKLDAAHPAIKES